MAVRAEVAHLLVVCVIITILYFLDMDHFVEDNTESICPNRRPTHDVPHGKINIMVPRVVESAIYAVPIAVVAYMGTQSKNVPAGLVTFVAAVPLADPLLEGVTRGVGWGLGQRVCIFHSWLMLSWTFLGLLPSVALLHARLDVGEHAWRRVHVRKLSSCIMLFWLGVFLLYIRAMWAMGTMLYPLFPRPSARRTWVLDPFFFPACCGAAAGVRVLFVAGVHRVRPLLQIPAVVLCFVLWKVALDVFAGETRKRSRLVEWATQIMLTVLLGLFARALGTPPEPASAADATSTSCWHRCRWFTASTHGQVSSSLWPIQSHHARNTPV